MTNHPIIVTLCIFHDVDSVVAICGRKSAKLVTPSKPILKTSLLGSTVVAHLSTTKINATIEEWKLEHNAQVFATQNTFGLAGIELKNSTQFTNQCLKRAEIIKVRFMAKIHCTGIVRIERLFQNGHPLLLDSVQILHTLTPSQSNKKYTPFHSWTWQLFLSPHTSEEPH